MRELDRPIWHALTTRQRCFAQGSELALCFDPRVSPFAACRDNEPASLEALAALAPETPDIDDMVELANVTKPGPFLPDTSRLGGFVGIRVDGRLAAMVGERLKLGSYTEVSAVCTHPDFRGRGMAAQLSSLVVERILTRGERPFLHAFADNHQAIRLYEQLGFARRCDMNVLALVPRGHQAKTSPLPHVR